MAKGKTSGTRPTGPNAKTQGKPLGVHYKPANQGPVDGPHSNGNWDASSGRVGNVKTSPQRGSRKSF